MFIAEEAKHVARNTMGGGKGGVLLTLPPPPPRKESQLFQMNTGFGKKIFLKIVLPHKLANCECIPFLFFFKISQDMIEGCMKDVRTRRN